MAAGDSVDWIGCGSGWSVLGEVSVGRVFFCRLAREVTLGMVGFGGARFLVLSGEIIWATGAALAACASATFCEAGLSVGSACVDVASEAGDVCDTGATWSTGSWAGAGCTDGSGG